MSLKKIFLSFIVLITIISSVSSGKEKGIKRPMFDPLSFLREDSKLLSLSDDGDDVKLINIKCLYSHDYNIYSLQVLQNKEKDYEVKLENSEKVLFNFCQNTVKDSTSTIVRLGENNTVTRLAGSIEGEEKEKNNWNQIGNKTNPIGLQIELVQGDKCGNDSRHQTTIEIMCNATVDTIDSVQFLDEGECIHKLKLNSLYGCSLRSTYLFLKLLQDYKIVFCILFVVIGIVLVFFGYKYLRYAIIIICGFIGCYAITAAILNFFPNFITTETYLLICLVVCFILGCAIGFLLKDDVKFNIILLGGFLGYSAAKFVYQIVQNYVDYDPEIVYYACLIGCPIIGAIVGYFLSDFVIIVGTSVFGGYLAMRGVSLVAEHYLDEGYIIDLIKSKEWEQLKEIRDGWTYAYLGMWAVLALAGIIIQCKNKKNNKQVKSNQI
jgi:hypothetical protein